MVAELKIHLFKVTWQPDSQPLGEILAFIDNTSLEDRLQASGRQEIRLDVAIPPDQHRPYWLLDFGNIRFATGPGKASRETPTQSFALLEGEGFAEETAALYDPKNRAMLIQYNHYGPRVGAIQDYLSGFNKNVTNIYDLNLVLRTDAQIRLAKKKLFTKLVMKVAPAKLSQDYKVSNVALATALARTQEDFGGDYVTLEIGLNRTSKSQLKLSNLLESFKRLVNEQDAISELKIAGKEHANEKSELINLLEYKLETTISNLPLDPGLRIPRQNRWNALESAYRGWVSHIRQP